MRNQKLELSKVTYVLTGPHDSTIKLHKIMYAWVNHANIYIFLMCVYIEFLICRKKKIQHFLKAFIFQNFICLLLMWIQKNLWVVPGSSLFQTCLNITFLFQTCLNITFLFKICPNMTSFSCNFPGGKMIFHYYINKNEYHFKILTDSRICFLFFYMSMKKIDYHYFFFQLQSYTYKVF